MVNIMVSKDTFVKPAKRVLLTLLILQLIRVRKLWISGLNMLNVCLMATL